MPLYHATLTCDGLSDAEAAGAPARIEAAFRERPWHQDVTCRWDGRLLWLEARNDFDDDGRALLDEFWDVVHANVDWKGPVRFEIVSVREVSAGD
jgi:hypothetical protein